MVSNVFGRAETFTIIEVEDNHVEKVDVIENPGLEYKYGSGPIAVKTLIDLGVEVVISSEFGPSVLTILQQHEVKTFKVKSGLRVRDALKKFLMRE